jgi:tetratricopeptide (TPR) repeat protein
MRNENEPSGLARRGFLAAGLAATAVLPLLSGPARATADAAVEDPDQLFANGLFAAADRGYARLLAADPGDAHAWAQRGYIALLSNRLTTAERFLGAALRQAPADQNSALWLAQCHVRPDHPRLRGPGPDAATRPGRARRRPDRPDVAGA